MVADLRIPSNHSWTVTQTTKYQTLQAINNEALQADIKNCELIRYPKNTVIGLAQQYDSVLCTLINVHAPLVTKKISPKPPNLRMTTNILSSKRHRRFYPLFRYLERIWGRNPTHLCNRQKSKAKSAPYCNIIAEHSGDHRSLWKAFNKILNRCPTMHLPDPPLLL